MKKSGYIILWSVVGAMVIAIGIGLFFAIKEKLTRITAETVDVSDWVTEEDIELNKYYAASTDSTIDGSDTFFSFNDDNTFALGSAESSLAQGTYSVENNEVITTYTDSYSTSSAEYKLMVEGDFLFFESNVCDGDEIPDTDTFEAKVSRVDSTGYGYQYEFREDGTYTYTYGDADDCTKWTVAEGTYVRNDDNTLTLTLNDKEVSPVYISHNHIITSIYKAITEEEYDAAMEEASESTETTE